MNTNDAEQMLMDSLFGVTRFNDERDAAAANPLRKQGDPVLRLKGLDLSADRFPSGKSSSAKYVNEDGEFLFDEAEAWATVPFADFTDCDLAMANFSGTRMFNVKFIRCNIKNAIFTGASVPRCSFAGADLSGVIGLRLDGNDLRDVRFPPNTSEAWHTIRRAYTGTKFFFHLLLLTIFFVSMGLRAAMWIGVNRAQTAVVHAAERVDAAAMTAQATHPELAAVIHEAAQELSKVTQTFTDTAKTYQVWEVLVGLDRGWGACGLAFLLLFYNIGRCWLTYQVGAMRDESDRCGFAPYWKDYKNAWYIHHYMMRYMTLVAVLAFIYHAWFWLTTPVVLPG